MRAKKLKTHYKIFFAVLVFFLVLVFIWNLDFSNRQTMVWGATFSKKQAEELGLDWRLVYGAVVDELPFKTIRLPIYWPDVEKAPNKFDFSDYGWMINKAAEKGIQVMPVLGRRVPRWPECHVPKFYQNLPASKLQPKIFSLIAAEVAYFKKFDNIKKWQIDNEPFAGFFGQCPPGDEALVAEEVKLVKNLDQRPVVITESGELSWWLKGAKLADILGVSVYRQTWSRYWGWFDYPLPPAYYFFKTKLAKLFTGIGEVIDTELQVEPWTKGQSLKDMDLFDQFYSMDLDQVKTNLTFAKKTGFKENYLWGIEWWWWLGAQKGHWEFWNFGKTIK